MDDFPDGLNTCPGLFSPPMNRVVSLAGLLSIATASALEIEIRYDYDTSGFFNQAGSKEAMEAVADFFEQRIHDSLLGIDQAQHGGTWSAGFYHPSTGNWIYHSNLVVPEDTLIVFVGARNLGGSVGLAGPGGYSYRGLTSWANRIKYRGQTGAAATPATDFGPWGGSISFDNSAGTSWSFQLDGSPTGSQLDFVSIALHEMCHVLGFGSSDSFDDKISGGKFTGANAVNSFGANIPLYSDNSHWKDDGCGSGPFAADSMMHGSFSSPHGDSQVALMDPVTCSSYFQGHLDVLTDLDLAALVDIGWVVKPPLVLGPSTIQPTSVSISWPSCTWLSYRVNRSQSPTGWTTLYGPSAGDGDDVDWQDPSPPTTNALYQLRADFALSPPPEALLRTADSIAVSPQSATKITRLVTGCGQHRH